MSNAVGKSIKGVSLSSTAANIRYQGRDDLLLVSLAKGSRVAATFTQSHFAAAPVLIAKQHLSQTDGKSRALLINAGNANAATGQAGFEACEKTCQLAAEALQIKPEEVLPFSTGVIGELLPTEPFEQHLPALSTSLSDSEQAWDRAAKTILTTDTRVKLRDFTLSFGSESNTTNTMGFAKGAGMIMPNMATMLAYVATDLDIDQATLDWLCSCAVDLSFNAITVDSDTSTNDSCVLISTGQSGIKLSELSDLEQRQWFDELVALMQGLAQDIIRDAEGANKFIEINVTGARSDADAKIIAYSVANSPLVKTAMYASDPNWGRIAAAIGKAPVTDIDQNNVSIAINQVSIMAKGQLASGYTEEKGQAAMAGTDIVVDIDCGLAATSATVWTSDLSDDYVKINADYRS